MKKRITTIKYLFVLLFFISIGSLINPFPPLGLGAILVATILFVITKFAGGYVLEKLFLQNARKMKKCAFLFGPQLIPRGEFSFVIGQLAPARDHKQRLFAHRARCTYHRDSGNHDAEIRGHKGSARYVPHEDKDG